MLLNGGSIIFRWNKYLPVGRILHKNLTRNIQKPCDHCGFNTSFFFLPFFFVVVKHLSSDPAVCPCCNAAMGGAKLMNVTKHSPDSWKENMLSLLTGLGKGYCCILLPQIRPEGKVLSSQIAFCAHTTRIANVSVAHFTDSKFIQLKSTRNSKYWQTDPYGWKTWSVISVSA